MIKYYAVTHPGYKRTRNEDCFFIGNSQLPTEGRTFFDHLDMAVCDGMGGEHFGDEASQAAIDVLYRYCCQNTDFDSMAENRILEVCLQANQAVCDVTKAKGALAGSTLCFVRFFKKQVVLANVGDSRIYRVREGRLEQLSVDHSVIGRLLRNGEISREEAKNHPAAHKLTQHLGIDPEDMLIEPYIITETVRAEDIYLICSDGLTDMVEDSEILNILNEDSSLGNRGNKLLESALSRGGKDNITIALAEIWRF